MKALLPPPVQQALQGRKRRVSRSSAGSAGGDRPDEAPRSGTRKGQLDAAKQALQERDQKVRDLEAQIKARARTRCAKMYDADMKALAEVTRARSEVLIAQAKALEIQAQQPDNAQVQAVTQALGHFAGEMDAKIAALTNRPPAIKAQLTTSRSPRACRRNNSKGCAA
jgi:hypothetical protein